MKDKNIITALIGGCCLIFTAVGYCNTHKTSHPIKNNKVIATNEVSNGILILTALNANVKYKGVVVAKHLLGADVPVTNGNHKWGFWYLDKQNYKIAVVTKNEKTKYYDFCSFKATNLGKKFKIKPLGASIVHLCWMERHPRAAKANLMNKIRSGEH